MGPVPIITFRALRTLPRHTVAPSRHTSRVVLTYPHIRQTIGHCPPYLLRRPHKQSSAEASGLNPLWFRPVRRDHRHRRLALGTNSVTHASQRSASIIPWRVALTPHPLQHYHQLRQSLQSHGVAHQSRKGNFVTRLWNRFGVSTAGRSSVRDFSL